MRTVVVGVDDTPQGRAALRWAMREAGLRDVPVRAVRAWTRRPVPAAVLTGGGRSDRQDDAADLAEMLVDGARFEVGPVAVGIVPVHGDAGPALVGAAAGAELLVVGTRGAGAVSRALLGSVTEHALRHAACPVVVVPAPFTASSRPPRVLVGVDGSPGSAAAVRWATAEAALRDWALVPVRVHDGVDGPVPVDGGPVVVGGHAGKALVHAAEPQDLLVVGAHRRVRRVLGELGSTSSYVAEHAVGPVVVVPPEPGAA